MLVLLLFLIISPCKEIETGGKPDFPKGFKGHLVFIVYILKIDAISFGDFINLSTPSSPSSVKTFRVDDKEDNKSVSN